MTLSSGAIRRRPFAIVQLLAAEAEGNAGAQAKIVLVFVSPDRQTSRLYAQAIQGRGTEMQLALASTHPVFT
jgi:hypothetical protein